MPSSADTGWNVVQPARASRVTDMRIVTPAAACVGQTGNKFMGSGLPRGVEHGFLVGIRPAIENIFPHRTMQQGGILRRHTNVRPQTFLGDLCDILSVD